MARPKLGDSATERLHLKITADEIAAIDEWQHLNRLPNRSEAIRRLCRIALGASGELLEIAEHIWALSDAASQSVTHAIDFSRLSQQRTLSEAEVTKLIDVYWESAADVRDRVDVLTLLVDSALDRISPLHKAKTMRTALENSAKAERRAARAIRAYDRKQNEYDENRIIAMVATSQTPEERAAYEALSERAKDLWWSRKIKEVRAAEARQKIEDDE